MQFNEEEQKRVTRMLILLQILSFASFASTGYHNVLLKQIGFTSQQIGFWGSVMGSINNTAFVEKKIVNSAKVLNLSTATILFKIIIPFNMPRIINALPIRLASALMTLTVAEMLGADKGMGYYVRFSLNFANYTKAIAGIIFIGFVVTVLNGIIDMAKKHFIKGNY